MTAAPAGAGRLYFGWVVVAATFCVLLTAFGTAYSFAAFFTSLQAEFDATRGETALVFSISSFIFFGFGAVSGPLADRFGARPVVIAGMLLTAAGLMGASLAQSMTQVYLAYGVGVGLGVAFVYVPAIATVQRWFVRRRGLASGLAVAGVGVGTLVIPLAAARLIETEGWRGTYFILAFLPLVVGIGAALFLEHSPARRGLRPDGDGGGAAAPMVQKQMAEKFATPRQALRSPVFHFLYAAIALNSFAVFIPFVHLAAYAGDAGIGGRAGILLIGLIGVGSIAGRFVIAGAADGFGLRRSLAVMYAGMGLMMVWWLASSSFWALAVFAVLFGVFYGGMVALIPALTADYFGGVHAGAIIGLLYTAIAIGTLPGPALAGLAFDITGAYGLAIGAGVAVNLAAAALIAALPDPD